MLAMTSPSSENGSPVMTRPAPARGIRAAFPCAGARCISSGTSPAIATPALRKARPLPRTAAAADAGVESTPGLDAAAGVDASSGVDTASGGKRRSSELDARLRALSSRSSRCRLLEGWLARDLLARRSWQPLGFVRVGDYTRERLFPGSLPPSLKARCRGRPFACWSASRRRATRCNGSRGQR